MATGVVLLCVFLGSLFRVLGNGWVLFVFPVPADARAFWNEMPAARADQRLGFGAAAEPFRSSMLFSVS